MAPIIFRVHSAVTAMGDEYEWWQPQSRLGWCCPACMGCCKCAACQRTYDYETRGGGAGAGDEEIKKEVMEKIQEKAVVRFRRLQATGALHESPSASQERDKPDKVEVKERKPKPYPAAVPYAYPADGNDVDAPVPKTPPYRPPSISPALSHHSRSDSGASVGSLPLNPQQMRALLQNLKGQVPEREYEQLRAQLEAANALQQQLALVHEESVGVPSPTVSPYPSESSGRSDSPPLTHSAHSTLSTLSAHSGLSTYTQPAHVAHSQSGQMYYPLPAQQLPVPSLLPPPSNSAVKASAHVPLSHSPGYAESGYYSGPSPGEMQRQRQGSGGGSHEAYTPVIAQPVREGSLYGSPVPVQASYGNQSPYAFPAVAAFDVLQSPPSQPQYPQSSYPQQPQPQRSPYGGSAGHASQHYDVAHSPPAHAVHAAYSQSHLHSSASSPQHPPPTSSPPPPNGYRREQHTKDIQQLHQTVLAQRHPHHSSHSSHSSRQPHPPPQPAPPLMPAYSHSADSPSPLSEAYYHQQGAGAGAGDGFVRGSSFGLPALLPAMSSPYGDENGGGGVGVGAAAGGWGLGTEDSDAVSMLNDMSVGKSDDGMQLSGMSLGALPPRPLSLRSDTFTPPDALQ